MRWLKLKRVEFRCKRLGEWSHIKIYRSTMKDLWPHMPASLKERRFAQVYFDLNKETTGLLPLLTMLDYDRAELVGPSDALCLADVDSPPTEEHLSELVIEDYGEFIEDESLKKVFSEYGSKFVVQQNFGRVFILTKEIDMFLPAIAARLTEQLKLGEFDRHVSVESMAVICDRANNGLIAYISDVSVTSGTIQVPFLEMTKNKLANTFTLTLSDDSQILSELSFQKNVAQPVTDTQAFNMVMFFSVVSLLLFLLIAFIYAVFF